MQLYYTGAKTPDAVQISPDLSLGGYKSSSLIPNGNLSNLFPTITKQAIIENKKNIKMIALKNTTGVIVTGLRIWTTSVKFSKVLIAAVAPAIQNGIVSFEEIAESTSIPYQAVLESREGESLAIEVGNLAVGATIGLWIQRELDLTKFGPLDKGTSPNWTNETEVASYIAALEAGNIIEEDEIRVVFDWT